MININKTNSKKIQKLLDKEKVKVSGNYNLPEVVEEIEKDFYSKCYLCEQKVKSANIEHFIPHEGDKEKMFDLKNLYLACSHCNSVKGVVSDILDCASTIDDVEKLISCYIDVYLRSNVIIQSKSYKSDLRSNNTVDLLQKIYNGNTSLRNINSEQIKNSLRTEIRRFYDLLIKYFESNVEENKRNALTDIMALSILYFREKR